MHPEQVLVFRFFAFSGMKNLGKNKAARIFIAVKYAVVFYE
jgi:hypothetical protein